MTALVKLLLKNGEFYTEEFRNKFSGQGSILKNPTSFSSESTVVRKFGEKQSYSYRLGVPTSNSLQKLKKNLWAAQLRSSLKE